MADTLVIGGGITGASVARDAALRGLSVVLVERDDFASGTSSRSSKLIHGGLRYLQTYQFKMVNESVREREVMMRIAPHLADLQPFMYLIYDGYPEGRARVNVGLTFYDAFSRAPLRRWHRMLGRDAVLRREPHLNPSGLKGAGLYHDALTDDARLVLDVLESASRAGALLANHREVTALIRKHGRVAGAEIVDRLTGDQITVRARTVVNAAGPWVDRVLALERVPERPTLRPTKGVHIVLRTEDFPLRTAVFLRSPSDDRVVWPTPAGDGRHVYVGTTDTDFTGSIDDVVGDEEDFAYLLEAANHTLPDAHVDSTHIVASWAGLRPLIAPAAGTSNSAASREHTITTGPDGMITAAGGKLTTARLMGAQIVDAVAEQLRDRDHVRGLPESVTASAAISGGDPGEVFRAQQAVAGAPVPPEVRGRWLRRYGGNATDLARAATRNQEQGQPIAGSVITPAEIEHAVHREMAMTVSDVLVRRTGSFFWSADGDIATIERVCDVLDAAHAYTPAQRHQQQTDYMRWVQRNRGIRIESLPTNLRRPVRCEECRDLAALDRIGQTPEGLLGGLGETGPAQRQSEMLPGVLHRHHQVLVVLLAIGGSRPQEISGHQGRCAPSADRCPPPPTRTRTDGGTDCRTAGRRILVYDDVCTTASQLNAVAECLLDDGRAAAVEGLVLARAPWRRQT